MATSLQQLLDALSERATAPGTAAAVEDVAGAMAHLGRALTGMTDDGLTPGASARQQTAADLAAACTTVGRLWPRPGGPLTDLAGAAADLAGRDRAIMGRAHRWAVTVTLAETADHCARLAHRLWPQAAVTELAAVRRQAAAVERDAQTDPPTPSGAAVLDRPVPLPGLPRAGAGLMAADAAAALTTALDRALRADGLSLRDFRAAVAAAEITSDCAAAVAAAAAGDEAAHPQVAALAWDLVGRISTTFTDGRTARSPDPVGVVPWARALADTLRSDVRSTADLAALRARDDLPRLSGTVQQVANQLPALADRLTAAAERWSRTGQLYARARDLPPMDHMPEDRVRDVVAGRHIRAHGADLDRLRRALTSASELSDSLADAVNRAAPPGNASQRHLAGLHAHLARAPGAGERFLRLADETGRAVAHLRSQRGVGLPPPRPLR